MFLIQYQYQYQVFIDTAWQPFTFDKTV